MGELQDIWKSDKIIFERKRIDKIYAMLSNGFKVSVHLKERLINIVDFEEITNKSIEEFLSTEESEKIILNQYFVDFISVFGLAALLASVRNKGIPFTDNESLDELHYVDEVDVNIHEKLIQITLTF